MEQQGWFKSRVINAFFMGLHQIFMIKRIIRIILFDVNSAIEAVQKNGILLHNWINPYDFYCLCYLHNICGPGSVSIQYNFGDTCNDHQIYKEKIFEGRKRSSLCWNILSITKICCSHLEDSGITFCLQCAAMKL